MLVRGTVRNRLLVSAVASVALVSVGVVPASAAPVADQTQTIVQLGVISPSYQTAPAIIQTDVGSSFTAGLSGLLSRIDIPVLSYTQSGSPKLDAQLQVWNVDGLGLPTGAALATQVIPEATVAPFSTAAGTLNMTFVTPATVTAGTKYAFTIGFVPFPTGTPNSVLNMAGGNAVAADKRFVTITNGMPYVSPSGGINFTTYVDVPAPPAAPSLAKTGFDAQPYLVLAGGLLGLGVIAFGISSALRRRKA